MNNSAADYNSKGLELANAGRHDMAIKFFTMAIDEDSDFLEAYKNRGEALIKLDRVAEGEKDLKKAEGSEAKSEKVITKPKKTVAKYNLAEAEDLYSSILTEDNYYDDDDLVGLGDYSYDDDLLTDEQDYDDSGDYQDDLLSDEQDYDDGNDYQDDLLTDDQDVDPGNDHGHESLDEQAFATDVQQPEQEAPAEKDTFAEEVEDNEISEETVQVSPEPEDSSAILEFIGGLRQEVTHARLCEPLENTILIVDEEVNDEQVVFFEQLTCLRVSALPKGTSAKQKEGCTKEAIETVDGKIYNELVHPEQDLDNILICLTADDQIPFKYTLFPESNIKKRSQKKLLTDMLLEKRYISKFMLQKALQEFKQLKSMSLERIIAQKAHVRLAEIEEALAQAEQNQMQGMQKEEILLISGLADEEKILDAVEYFEKIQTLKIGQFLVEKGVVKENEVYSSLAEKHKIPFVDLKGRKFSQKYLAALPKSMIVNNEVLPLVMKDDILLVATSFIDTKRLREAIAKTAACKDVKFVLSPPSQIKKIISMLFANKK